ncbi:AEC family transporter [Tropicimonas sp. TH_r6]|uniref:AEC family transporter n=1 Tax=Tropicimonas sp. TH_r6 TaxID=3082085 RepID=UPI002953583F|nr:AEC family transporter [Tropicimonas sp. TH_r6]MDV7143619.1 AEC family transporter [Tropicimonas sp. TH_r6]
MNIVLTVLEITSPVFLLAALGIGWDKAGWDYPVEFVTRLAMTLAVPCLVFTSLMKTEVDPSALAAISIAAFCAYGVIALASWALVRAVGLDRGSYLAPLTFGNTGNLGLPLALFAFGAVGLDYAVVVLAVTSILVFTIGIWMVSGTSNPTRVLREPIFVATVLGLVFLWQGWQLPVWLINGLTLVGQMAIPLMLLTLGVAIGKLRPADIGPAVLLSLIKAAICGFSAVAVGLAFALPPIPFAVLVVQMITPVPVTSYLLAVRFGVDSGAVAGLVVVSSLLSVAVLPIALAFLL